MMIRSNTVYACETDFVDFKIKHVLGHKTVVTIYRNNPIPTLKLPIPESGSEKRIRQSLSEQHPTTLTMQTKIYFDSK